MIPALPALAMLAAQLAPELARHLGGQRAGEIAEKAVSVVETVVGARDPETAAALLTDPQKASELRVALARIAAEADAAERAAELEAFKAAMADRANARAMAADDPWTPRLLAGAVVLAWVGLNGSVLAWGLPYGASEIISRALGGLDALLLLVFGFYFGSSLGSKEKTAALAGRR